MTFISRQRIAAQVICALLSVAGGCGVEPEGQTDEATVQVENSPLALSGAAIIDWGGACNRNPGSPTQCQVNDASGRNPTIMHCCPNGFGMQGLYAQSDSYSCKPVPFVQVRGSNPNVRDQCVWRQAQPSFEGQTMLGCNDGE